MAKKKNVNVWGNYELDINEENSDKEVSDVETPNSENVNVQKFENPNVQTSENIEMQTDENVNVQKSTFSVKKNTLNKGKNGRKKPAYKDMGWLPLTMYLSPRAKKKLSDKGYKEQKNLSEILDELILNNL